MKNLVNHLRWASEMPSRQRFWEHAHIGQRLKARKEYRGYYAHEKWRVASRILTGCNGRPMSYVYSRLKPLFQGYKESANEFLASNLSKFVRFTKSGKSVFTDKDGDEVINGGRWGREVCWEENGILRVHNFREKPTRTRFDARKHYAYLTHRRKSNKESRIRNEQDALMALKLINKQTLFPMYRKLKERQMSYTKYLLTSEDYAYARKHGRWYLLYKREERRRQHMELKKVEEDLDMFYRGDFSKFFKSSEYLYTLHKECHHVAPSPHLPKPLS